MAKILIAEDDTGLGSALKDYLSGQGHVVDWARDGREASEHLLCYKYDLLILDWEMPNKTGLQVVAEFRDRGGATPVLFLTGKSGTEHKVSGLDSGADDYMTKPFSFEELGARVRALVRRESGGGSPTLTSGDLTINTTNKTVRFKGELVHLAPREFALLEFLLRHKGQVFSNEALLDRVWDSASDAGPDMVRATIKRIRKKLGMDAEDTLIRNVFGSGYVLD